MNNPGADRTEHFEASRRQQLSENTSAKFSVRKADDTRRSQLRRDRLTILVFVQFAVCLSSPPNNNPLIRHPKLHQLSQSQPRKVSSLKK